MRTKDFLRKHEACIKGAEWALSISDDIADVWDAMIEQGKHEWLIWTVSRPGVFTDTVLRKLACRFIREIPLHDGRKIWDLLTDERSRKAVAVAELYAAGKATYEELAAAYAAAYAAADAADVADVDAAFAASGAAAYVADVAVYAATDAAYAAYAIDAAASSAARDAAYVAARDAAKAAQMKMIAELGNPFTKERTEK